jgi:hypothetical protein
MAQSLSEEVCALPETTRVANPVPTGMLRRMVIRLEIRHLYIAPEHNYFGHHGKAPGVATMMALDAVECVAGKGIRGDRFFGYKQDYKGQITFFEEETYDDLCAMFQVWDRDASAFRRNVITRGIRLNQLIDKEFTIEGIHFRGMEECKPCYWMDQAFHSGAEEALKGRGGLRAKILSDGTLRRGSVELSIQLEGVA